MASVVFSLIGVAAGGLYYMHGKIIKEITASSQKNLDAEYALAHMVKNIQGSAWVTVLNPNNIELHSHTNPNIRKYSLENGSLVYAEGNKGRSILARNLEADVFFLGENDTKPYNRYKKVQIEFRVKPPAGKVFYNSDTFYTKSHCFCRENWDAIYVDTVRSSSFQDGTKIFPFQNITSALAIASEYPQFSEEIFVISGDHVVSEDAEFKSRFIYFTPETTLKILPGITAKFGNSTLLYIKGEITFSGEEGRRVNLTSLSDPMWNGIELDNNQDAINLSYITLSNSENGIRMLENTGAAGGILITNSYAYNNYYCFSVYGPASITAYNNQFLNNYGVALYIYTYLYTQPAIPIATSHYIYQNEFNYTLPNQNYGYGAYIYEYSNGFISSMTTSIHDNVFNNLMSAITYYDLYYGTLSRPILDAQIYNNYISAATGITLATSYVDPASRISITNNTVDSRDTWATGIYLSSGAGTGAGLPPFIISNNKVSFNGPYGSGIKVYGLSNDSLIKNNVIYGTGSNLGILSSGNTQPMVTNNILYGNAGISIYTWTGSQEVRLTNNTIAGGRVYAEYYRSNPTYTITNNIIWGTSYLLSFLQNYASYSDVRNMSQDPARGIISQDPRFVAPENNDYHLSGGSPCIGTGKNPDGSPTDMGAYGGAFAADWANGAGRTP